MKSYYSSAISLSRDKSTFDFNLRSSSDLRRRSPDPLSARPKAVRRSSRRDAPRHRLAPPRRVGRAAEGLVPEEASTVANASTTTTATAAAANVSTTANASATAATTAASCCAARFLLCRSRPSERQQVRQFC